MLFNKTDLVPKTLAYYLILLVLFLRLSILFNITGLVPKTLAYYLILLLFFVCLTEQVRMIQEKLDTFREALSSQPKRHRQ